MCPSLIEIGSKTAEKNSAQTNKQTDRHYENNGHLAVNQQRNRGGSVQFSCNVDMELRAKSSGVIGLLQLGVLDLSIIHLPLFSPSIAKQPRPDIRVFRLKNCMVMTTAGLPRFTVTTALQPVATCRRSPYLRPVPSATKPAIIPMTSFSL